MVPAMEYDTAKVMPTAIYREWATRWSCNV